MAKENSQVDLGGGISESASLDRIAKLLALLAFKDAPKEASALKLRDIGFSHKEIALLLDVNDNFVNTARFRKKNSDGKAKK